MITFTNTQDVGRKALNPADYPSFEAALKAVDHQLRATLAARRTDETIDMVDANNAARRDIRKAEQHFNVDDVATVERLAAVCSEDDLLTKIKTRNEYIARHVTAASKDQRGHFPFPSQYISFRNFLADNGDIVAEAASRGGME